MKTKNKNLTFTMVVLIAAMLFLGAVSNIQALEEVKKRIGVEGLIDLADNAGRLDGRPSPYTEQYLTRAVIEYADHGSAMRVDYGKRTYYDEGSFEHNECWTNIVFKVGHIEMTLRDPKTGQILAQGTNDVTLNAYFASDTDRGSTCYPHDYPSFDRDVSFKWDPFNLAISTERSLQVTPFYFYYNESLSPITGNLYGRAHVEKENGVYVLKSLDLTDALNKETWDSTTQSRHKVYSYMKWDHFKGQEPDVYGYVWGKAQLIEHP